jgi:hypothetical protein
MTLFFNIVENGIFYSAANNVENIILISFEMVYYKIFCTAITSQLAMHVCFEFNIKGVIWRIILFDSVLAKAEMSLLTPFKLKSDC